MLTEIGEFVEKKPGVIIVLVIATTLFFASFIPSIEFKTSSEEFMPDNEVAKANERVVEYFGENQKVLMIYVEKQNAENTLDPGSLREEFGVLQKLKKHEEVEGTIGVSVFVNTVCEMEYGKTLLNCSDREINDVVDNLLNDPSDREIRMMDSDDPNEKNDYKPFPMLNIGREKNSVDIKNYYLQQTDDKLVFSIEVYDLSKYKSELLSSFPRINVFEWYVEFKNLIAPNEALDVQYLIAAHVEPLHPLWELGDGVVKNLKMFLNNLKKHELYNTYGENVFLWVGIPNNDVFIPFVLDTGNITFDYDNNRIIITVEKKELGKYGLAPEFEDFALPGKIGHTRSGFRYYKSPFFSTPWRRITVNPDLLAKIFENTQKRPLLRNIASKITSRFTGFSLSEINEMFEKTNFTIDEFSLKNISNLWVNGDVAPDDGFSTETLFLKPRFMEELKTAAYSFLPLGYPEKKDADKTLMLLFINGSLKEDAFDVLSMKLADEIEKEDVKKNFVTMRVSNDALLMNEINNIAAESNAVIMPLIFIAILALLFITFRKISNV